MGPDQKADCGTVGVLNEALCQDRACAANIEKPPHHAGDWLQILLNASKRNSTSAVYGWTTRDSVHWCEVCVQAVREKQGCNCPNPRSPIRYLLQPHHKKPRSLLPRTKYILNLHLQPPLPLLLLPLPAPPILRSII